MNSLVCLRFPPLGAVGDAPGGENVSVVPEAIQQRGGELLVDEHLHPFGERQVSRLLTKGFR